ncbi:MAG: T9SS type A sorting domain-containing protein [Ignavibacteriaceae bacterium]|nr:T9SS type A sorting domain-containing protein [Ignavibacteriaceae bacterium]
MNRNILLVLFIFILFFPLVLKAQQVHFTDVADAIGVNPPIQFIRGSVSFCDFNDDGLEDLSFSSAQDFPLFIFKNDSPLFIDVTFSLQLNDSLRSMNLLWADYDNDGDKDLFCAIDFESNNYYSRLYRNDEGVMVDVTIPSGIGTEPSSCNAAAWADYNNDGWLDLFVTHYSEYKQNYLYKNNGDGSFTDVTNIAGVAGFDSTSGFYKLPFAIAFHDFDNDGWLDIHICNDHFTGDYQYRNNGNGTFSDVSQSSGADVSGFMMGIAVGDYDENGFLDLYLSNDPFGNYLLKNNGDGTFTDVAEELGLAVYKSCWGTNFIDYDNDGDVDLYVCAEIGTNAFFKNNGDGTFSQLTGIGLDTDNKSYGCAIGDLDNNGFYDIAVHNQQSIPNVYKNSGGANNWLKIKLTGVECNRDAIGSRIEAYVNGRKLIRELTCGISYMSQNSNSTIIGLGSSSLVDSIIVRWAGGSTIDILRNVSVNQTITLVEGETIVNVENQLNFPAEFVLNQNYPNPFNPNTKINFSLAVDSKVNLKVFDILGQEVANLISADLLAGSHNVDFNAASINSGVYFYRIEATGIDGTNFTNVKKMIITK